MATGYNKNNKTELIAIYRLEFYKKQKNWKFCQDLCKKPPDEPEKPLEEKDVLNKTYNIETDVEGDEATALNDAFVDTDSDKNPPQTPPTHDITRDWPDGGVTVPPSNASEATWTVPAKPWAEWRQDKCWQMPVSDKQVWQDVGQVLYEDGREAYFTDVPVELSNMYECSDYDKGWPAHSQVWTNDAGTADAVYHEGDTLDKLECDPTTVLSEAECWLNHEQTDNLWPFTTKEEISLESARAFMLGAAAAPHSSELDLRSHSTVSEADMSSATISSLSSRQLADSVHRHATLLRQLLLEARVREASTSLDNPLTNTPQPTRPPGPTLARSMDTFIAGSHNNVGGIEGGGVGRGRGRLASRGRGVGIGMGRPYWL